MNLNLYEKVDINRNKTWVDPVYKNLYSKELEDFSIFTILKRYNPKDRCTDYFLCLTNNPDINHKWDCVTKTKGGTTKIRLFNFWNLLPFQNKRKEFDIVISKVEEDEEGVIYYLDI